MLIVNIARFAKCNHPTAHRKFFCHVRICWNLTMSSSIKCKIIPESSCIFLFCGISVRLSGITIKPNANVLERQYSRICHCFCTNLHTNFLVAFSLGCLELQNHRLTSLISLSYSTESAFLRKLQLTKAYLSSDLFVVH